MKIGCELTEKSPKNIRYKMLLLLLICIHWAITLVNALYRHRHLVSVGQLPKWELSNEVERKTMASVFHTWH